MCLTKTFGLEALVGLIMAYYLRCWLLDLTHELTTPETHGTTTGADGYEFRYDSGYLSLKFS